MLRASNVELLRRVGPGPVLLDQEGGVHPKAFGQEPQGRKENLPKSALVARMLPWFRTRMPSFA